MGTTYEQSCLMKFKDGSGNLYILYPVTKKTNVAGIDEAIRNQYVETSGSGSAYIATVAGINALSVGSSFVMIPHVDSTTVSPTLNVNNLGDIRIRRRVTNSSGTTSSGATNDWLASGKPIRVTYDGNFWIADLPKPNATDLMGTVGIQNGGTGATTASAARTNIGAVGMTATTVVLSASGWSDNTQTVSVSGVTASNTVIISPVPSSYSDYGESGVRCTVQAAGTLTFTCDTTPSSSLSVNVVILS